ncbi:MAG: phytanoyl-CoA dioxygenase family protein [Caldilineaceae bacterium]|nr:phytanoyl-CoA dioxygenase family protein [Caldilineaceae bacterium]
MKTTFSSLMQNEQLLPEELFLFQHNGYLLITQALTPALVAELRATILQQAAARIPPLVCEDPERPGQPLKGDVPGTRVLRLSKVLSREPIFWQAATAPRLVAALTQLLEPNVEVVLNRHNHATLRPPGAAQLEWHRDVANWSRPVVTAIFYLEDSTVESGCTYVVPGSQQMLAYHGTLSGHGRLDTLGRLGQQAMPVLAKAGDVMLMHGLVIHSAGANGSASSRMSMTLGYHAADELGGKEEPDKRLVAGERILRHN